MKSITLDKLNLKGKKVLLRIDINSAIFKRKVVESDKIKAHSKTIKELVKKNARIVVLAHQGQPRERNFISLEQHAKILNKYVKIKFVDDVIGKKALNAIKKLKNKEVLLLENVRFLKEEFNPSEKNKFVKNIS